MEDDQESPKSPKSGSFESWVERVGEGGAPAHDMFGDPGVFEFKLGEFLWNGVKVPFAIAAGIIGTVYNRIKSANDQSPSTGS